MKFLDKLPFTILIPLALVMGLAPFRPQPHLLEKLTWLFNGTLTRPLDIFDLFMHSAPVLLLVVKVVRQLQRNRM